MSTSTPEPADSEVAVEARGLVKHFGATVALDGVDLVARRGTVVGLLGPNGAGKTTTVRVLSTLLRPDAGQAFVHGVDVVAHPDAVRRMIGLTGQYAAVDELLTGTQNLVMIGQLLDLPARAAKARARELLEWFDLSDAAGRPAKTYSGGMRRRLDLAASLVGRPSVVVLDEPTTGLDPVRREQMWGVVRGLVDDGSTVLLTTQYLEEADALADEITVVDHGRVVAHDTPAGLKRIVGGRRLEISPEDDGRADDVAAVLRGVGTGEVALERRGGSVRLSVAVDREDALPQAVARLAETGVAVGEMSLHLPSLDEVFLTLTGHRDPDSHSNESTKEVAA